MYKSMCVFSTHDTLTTTHWRVSVHTTHTLPLTGGYQYTRHTHYHSLEGISTHDTHTTTHWRVSVHTTHTLPLTGGYQYTRHTLPLTGGYQYTRHTHYHSLEGISTHDTHTTTHWRVSLASSTEDVTDLNSLAFSSLHQAKRHQITYKRTYSTTHTIQGTWPHCKLLNA